MIATRNRRIGMPPFPFMAVWFLAVTLSLRAAELAAQTVSQEFLRPSIDLSGEWEFKLDPLDSGRADKWFEEAVRYERRIQMPGAWNTQGVAYESESVLRDYEARLLTEQKQFFLGRLVRYSLGAEFAPEASLPESALRGKGQK